MKTATEIRAETMAIQSAFQRLAEHPELQVEAIAKHYLAHAYLSKDLVSMINLRRRNVTGLDEMIQVGIEFIKRNHAHDLGIPLEWRLR